VNPTVAATAEYDKDKDIPAKADDPAQPDEELDPVFGEESTGGTSTQEEDVTPISC
jgi:hypothetical protein